MCGGNGPHVRSHAEKAGKREVDRAHLEAARDPVLRRGNANSHSVQARGTAGGLGLLVHLNVVTQGEDGDPGLAKDLVHV